MKTFKDIFKKTSIYKVYHKYILRRGVKKCAKVQLKRMWVDNTLHEGFAQIGPHCQVGMNSTLIPQNIYMEDWSRIQNGCNMISWEGKLIVKKFAAISSCTIVPGAHVPTVGLPQFLSISHINDNDGQIVVNEDAWVGAGAILLSHCEIGRGAVVAAGTIVTKSIPPYAVVAGCPSKIIAVRFTIDQILEHEKILYPKEERMSREELEKLFSEYYVGKKTIGTSNMSDKDKEILSQYKNKYSIVDYSK